MSELPALSSLVLERLDAVVESMSRRVYSELPFYSEGDVSTIDLRRSIYGNLVPVLRSLSAAEPLDLGPARATGRERAEQNAPLPEVLRAFRIGFEELWHDLVTTARTTGIASDTSLVDAATTVWRLAGECTDALAIAYRASSTELAVQLEHRRLALLDALFLGTASDTTTLWEIGEALGTPLSGRFLVAITRSGEGQELTTQLRRHGVHSTWRWQPDALTGLLSLGRSTTEAAVLADLESSAEGDMGVSAVFEHLRDTPRALHDARIALTTLTHRGGKVVQYDPSPLAMLVSAAPVEAERISAAVLGELLALGVHERSVLIQTLRTWCANEGSPNRTAEQMHCHANTVRYRLRRIETLTGRSLRDPQQLAELVTALSALRVTSH
ncbi:PucR family transcriptional regulator [Kribbella antibiotica]|uniref:PucR family transcriptional regulator n=1 Tax=Kribbella antibiotica TaxID=190195 RepID=A0A4R4ZWL8_9ACTN|nr:helix-turn-helix domain-containing protein [Kribbella antibiotica]TDD62509.1 PucR family transcriptional regulator [Kribbella antibiotica]